MATQSAQARDKEGALDLEVIEYLKQNPKSTVGQLAKGLMVDVGELKNPL
jgi:hypothetical protein